MEFLVHYICAMDQVYVIKTKTFFLFFTFDILWFCMLYIVFCFGGALRVTGQVDVITGEREVHERAHRSITDPRSPSNWPEILN